MQSTSPPAGTTTLVVCTYPLIGVIPEPIWYGSQYGAHTIRNGHGLIRFQEKVLLKGYRIVVVKERIMTGSFYWEKSSGLCGLYSAGLAAQENSQKKIACIVNRLARCYSANHCVSSPWVRFTHETRDNGKNVGNQDKLTQFSCEDVLTLFIMTF